MPIIVNGEYKFRFVEGGSPVACANLATEQEHIAHRLSKDAIETYYALAGHIGMPFVHGTVALNGQQYVITNKLGPDIQALADHCGGGLSLNTVLKLGLQAISRIEWIHSKSYALGGIGNETFAMGIGFFSHSVYLAGFARVKHTSITARLIDLEGLGLFLATLLRGDKPWHDACNSHSTGDNHLPSVFSLYFERLKGLSENGNIDYDSIRDIFREQIADKARFLCDNVVDWHLISCKQKSLNSTPMRRYSTSGPYVLELVSEAPTARDLETAMKKIITRIEEARFPLNQESYYDIKIDLLNDSSFVHVFEMHKRLYNECRELVILLSDRSSPLTPEGYRIDELALSRKVYASDHLEFLKKVLPKSKEHLLAFSSLVLDFLCAFECILVVPNVHQLGSLSCQCGAIQREYGFHAIDSVAKVNASG